MTDLTTLDLFGAPGGMTEGFSQAEFKTLAAIDKFPWGCETFKHNHPETLVINRDIRGIVIPPLKRKMKSESVDIVTGGPPCQGFSHVGRPKIASLNGDTPNRLNDPRNGLYKIFFKFVKAFNPKFFVMENVPGILTLCGGDVRDDIVKLSEKLGYEVELGVLNAAEFGVPQTRKRVFFIGNRIGLEGSAFPEKTHGMEGENGYKPFVTLTDAISDLPELEAGSGTEEIEYPAPHGNPYQAEMRKDSENIYNHVARPHNKRDLEIFKHIKKGKKYTELPDNLKPYRDDIFKDKYHSLEPEKPSRTIVAHLSKDGLGFIHPGQDRSITVREAARLQSFPDRFLFKGARTWQFTQVGNAVPPILARSIAEKLKTFL